MEISEILNDALSYPFKNIPALLLYMVLGIIMAIAVTATAAAMAAGVAASNFLAVVGTGIIGAIIAVIIAFVISGYELDIIKYGILRDDGAPGIEIVNQFVSGVKLFVVEIVYFLIPIIIGAILAVIFQHWLSVLITIILFVIFALAAMMGQCRLAKTGDLGYALSIGEAISDITKVGIVKLLLFIICIFIISLILSAIAGLINQWNSIVGGIVMGIVGVYVVFFASRATGLLYSDI